MKLCKLLFVSFLFYSCSSHYLSPYMSVDDAWKKTSSFSQIHDEGEQYKSPSEFEKDGGGDCDDFTPYMMSLIGRGELIVMSYDYTNDEGKRSQGFHTALLLDGQILEPQSYNTYLTLGDSVFHFREIIVWTYDEVMSVVTLGGLKR
jgi:hypothetical protein